MAQNKTETTLAKKILIIISVHAILYILYSFAQEKITIIYTMSVYLPYILLFGLIPLILATVLLTNYIRLGVIVLLGVLPAAILNNIINRFTGLPILPIQEPALIWKIVFETSFGLILISEAIAFWFALKLLIGIHKQLKNLEPEKSNMEQ